VAVGFWQRMSQATGGGSSSLLSDHPSDAERISDIQKWIPEAKKYYRPANAATTTTTTTSSKKKKTTKTIKIK